MKIIFVFFDIILVIVIESNHFLFSAIPTQFQIMICALMFVFVDITLNPHIVLLQPLIAILAIGQGPFLVMDRTFIFFGVNSFGMNFGLYWACARSIFDLVLQLVLNEYAGLGLACIARARCEWGDHRQVFIVQTVAYAKMRESLRGFRIPFANMLRIKHHLMLLDYNRQLLITPFIIPIEHIENTMEYKYRMLCPFPYSNQSIQFKLSEAYLQSCTAFSPNKRDSLTYTVSMETIQDQEYSPLKHQNPAFLLSPESCQFLCDYKKAPAKSSAPYDLASHQPIISIRIQSQSQQLLSQPNKDAEQSNIELTMNIRQQGNIYEGQKRAFHKKSILKINNLGLNQTQVLALKCPKQTSLNNQSKKSMKMGKVMSRIHSQMKDQQTIRSRRRATSGKTIPSPIKEPQQKRNRAKSFDKIQNHNSFEGGNIYRTLNDKVNEEREGANNTQFQILNTEGAKNSILCKTNSSSNVCCSPEMVRRKSDIMAQNKFKIQKHYREGAFVTQRQGKEIGNYRSNLESNKNMIRERINSSIVHKNNYSNQFLSELGGSNEKSLIFKRIKSKDPDWNKMLRKSNGSNHIKPQIKINDSSLQIIALKFNLTDRNSIHSQGPLLRKKSISHQDKCDSNINIKKNLGQNKMDNEKQNSMYKELNNVEIDTKHMMEGIYKNKRTCKKIKENTPSKLFRL